MPNKNLEPGQYQLGSFVFGANTLFNVTQFDIGGWDVNAQDYQAQLSDETNFGSDSFKVNPIQIGITARTNRTLEHIAALTQDPRASQLNYDNDPRIGDFTREWRADEIRKKWGALKNLYVCRPDKSVVQVYGRPGKIAVSKEDPHSHARLITAEFRRSDTLCYNDFEWYLQARADEEMLIFRSSELKQGDAPSWVRLILVGPMTHPIINLGYITVELDYELEPGEIVEISSYPWARRVVRLNDGANLGAKLVRPYLKDLKFDVDTLVQLSWNATDTNAQVEQRDFSTYINTTEGLPTDDFYPTVYNGSTDGKYRILNGKMVWADSGNQERTGISIFKPVTVSPYQMVGITIANPAEAGLFNLEEPANRIIGRSNVTGTEYLYWEITFTQFWFGYHKDGNDYRVSPVYSISSFMSILLRLLGAFFEALFGQDDNWTYEAEFGTGEDAVGSTLRVNGVNLYTFRYQDRIYEYPALEANRNVGIGMRATNRVLGQSTPGTVSEFHMRDNPAVPQSVSGVYLFWRDAWQNI